MEDLDLKAYTSDALALKSTDELFKKAVSTMDKAVTDAIDKEIIRLWKEWWHGGSRS